MLPEKVLKHLCPPLISRKNHNLIVLLEIQLHILRRGLGTAGVGGELLCGNAGEGSGLKRISSHGKGVRHVDREVLQPLCQGLKAEIKAVRRHGHQAPAVQFPDIFIHLFCVIPGPLGAAVGLVKDDDGIFRNIVRPGGHGIDERQVPVRVGHGEPVFQPFRVFPQRPGKFHGVVAAAAFRVPVGKCLNLPGKGFCPAD